jgi:hypothetical protein
VDAVVHRADTPGRLAALGGLLVTAAGATAALLAVAALQLAGAAVCAAVARPAATDAA